MSLSRPATSGTSPLPSLSIAAASSGAVTAR